MKKLFPIGSKMWPRLVRYYSKKRYFLYHDLTRSENFYQTVTYIYQEAINISLDDPEITVQDAGNKGYAYLMHDNAFRFNALRCFQKAKELDKNFKWKEEINSGIKAVESNQKIEEIHFYILE